MNEFWDILTKELALYGIVLINAQECKVYQDGNFIQYPIANVLGSLRKRIKANGEAFEETWKELIQCLEPEQPIGTKEPLDKITINLFVNTLKNLFDFSLFLTENFEFNDSKLKYYLMINFKKIINRDYTQYPKETILCIPDYKIALDWTFRKISLLDYVYDMLKVARMGPKRISRLNIKTARGVSGPWANLDLPMLERRFPYADIAEEMEGRRRDIRKQRRYRQGHENYHGPNVGEGYYWRELRNEPFLWSNRDSDSPYPSRSVLRN